MIKAENFIIADCEEAQKYGFTIEGDVCFIFELGHYSVGCLGPGEGAQKPTWRFDTTNHEGTPYTFEEVNLNKAIQKAQAIAKGVAALEQARNMNDQIFGLLLQVFDCV